jgi:uncharacterized protein YceH (UPF0502 family)
MPEALGVDDGELALLGVLMLRGAQTPGELKQRSERLHAFADLTAVQTTLDGLVERGYVARHERRPGQKELRYEQLLGGFAEQGDEPAEVPSAANDCDGAAGEATGVSAPPGPDHDVALVPAEDRLTRVERELSELRAELGRLREALGEG